jgi:hypothetical protein
LEKVFDSVAKSVELLFLTAITWCFAFTSSAGLSEHEVSKAILEAATAATMNFAGMV